MTEGKRGVRANLARVNRVTGDTLLGTHPRGRSGIMSGEGLCAHQRRGGVAEVISVDKVSGAVAEWVDQVGRFLSVLQVAIEQSRPKDDATAEVRALSVQLPAMIRECRAQVPTPEMIRIWVKSLSGEDSEQPVGAGA